MAKEAGSDCAIPVRSSMPFIRVSVTDAKTQIDPTLGFEIVTEVAGVPERILVPRDTWQDAKVFDSAARKLAGLFVKDFEPFAAGTDKSVGNAGPRVEP